MQRISLLSIILALLFMGCENPPQESLLDIPDKAFLGTLLSQGVDRNGDGHISREEAGSITRLVIPPSGIRDLTGLDAFIQLDTFSITLNPLGSIDLSANRSLRYLSCTSCELGSLDLSLNTSLETVICGRNRLQDLDLGPLTALTGLICNNNLLTSLDLSANTSLETLITCGNQLTRLDISRHSFLTKIGFDNMPMLTEVCVWTLPFPPEGIVVLREYSPQVYYTTTCSQ